MKHLKKLGGVLLALVMVLALAAPAFASSGEKGSITVNNAIVGETYIAYKILDVTYDGEGNFSYTISTDSPWFDTVDDCEGLSVVVSTADPNVYVVTEGGNFSAAEFSGALTAALTNMGADAPAGTELSNDNLGTAKADNLELGYYYVTSTAGALCNLTTTDPNATIQDKNDVDFDKDQDVVDIEGVQVGDTITYTLKGKVPATAGFQKYVYTMSDTMSEGLTFNNDVKIYIGDVTITKDKDGKITGVTGGTNITNNSDLVVITTNDDDDGFVADFKAFALNNEGYAGLDITVVYTATVNEKAVGQVVDNKAELEYTNKPDGDTDKQEDEEKTYSTKIVIDKYDSEDKNTKLSGAEFVLRRATGEQDEDENDIYEYYCYDEGNQKVAWVDDIDEATHMTTDDDGAAEFIGLKKGTYELVETVAPDGYNLLTAPVEVKVGADVTSENLKEGTATTYLSCEVTVPNAAGALLPSTGGIGTTIFYVVGGVLVVGAVVLLITKRRTSVDDE